MDLTFVARLSDGLVLCESWSDRRRQLQQYKATARQLLHKMGKANLESRCSVDCGIEKTFHYKIAEGVIYLTLCDKVFPNKLAFAFLEEISKLFEEEIGREWGTHGVDHRSLIETIDKPYYFIRFDRVIQQRKVDYRDPRSSKALQRLNDNLVEVASIMRSNITDILQRGEHLEDVSRKAEDLKFHSKSFSTRARLLNLQALVHKYAPIVVVFVILTLVVVWRLWLR